MALNEERRYNRMEETLKFINGRFIALPQDEVRRNNIILGEVLQKLTQEMRNNQLFKSLFRGIYFGGSYYDGLKVGKPEEYDLDVLFDLPTITGSTVKTSDCPGFVKVHLETMHLFYTQLQEVEKYPNLKQKLLDEENYLLSHKVRYWMISLIQKALNTFPYGCQISTSVGVFRVSLSTSGPAVTLGLRGTANRQPVKLDVDLVPCFVFNQSNWPGHPYRSNPVRMDPNEFFVVPKSPNMERNFSTHWRLSFQRQESVLINNYNFLKPALRLIKKLRDTQDLPYIASYYIKTIFLWEVETERRIWNISLSCVFMRMLKVYQRYIESWEIPYYWNEENNLIDRPNRVTLTNTANRLSAIIRRIENNPEDVARYLLTSLEYAIYQCERYQEFDINIEPEAATTPLVVGGSSENASWCTLL